MDPFIIAAIISAIVIVLLSYAFIHVGSQVKPQAGARPRAVAPRDGGPGRVQAVRNQRARMRANAARHQLALEEEPEMADEPDEESPPDAQKVEFSDKMGAKKRAKLEAKMEKQKAREAEEQMREIKKKKAEELEAERKKVEEKEEEEERQREEAERMAEEQRKRREQEEYEALKAAFSVESEGFEESEEQDRESLLKDFIDYIKGPIWDMGLDISYVRGLAFSMESEGFEESEEQDRESLLKDFIDYIKAQKVVLLEDLAAHFKLKTQAAIDRITDLQASGELTGVIDDRGKFIYISQKELEDVAKFIKQRGRVSITELAECSNELINLNPVSVP